MMLWSRSSQRSDRLEAITGFSYHLDAWIAEGTEIKIPDDRSFKTEH